MIIPFATSCNSMLTLKIRSPLLTIPISRAPRTERGTDPLVRHDEPTMLQVTVNEQPNENRWIVHLLHYIPERRSQEIDIIEDVIPLYNIKISVKVPTIKMVMIVPEQEQMPYDQKDGRVEFLVPHLVGHQMIVLKIA